MSIPTLPTAGGNWEDWGVAMDAAARLALVDPSSFLPPAATMAALEAIFPSQVIYTAGAYPARPTGAPAGFVTYIGPSQPTTWLTGDRWINNS